MPRSAAPPELFDIMTSLREVIESGEHDPATIAATVAAAVPEQDLRAALERVLRNVASSHLGIHRRSIIQAVRHADDPARQRPSSQRWQGMAALVKRFRLADLAVPVDGVLVHKAIDDATPDEVRAAAMLRRAHAQSVVDEATRLEMLADRADADGAATIADLSDEAVAEVIQWQP